MRMYWSSSYPNERHIVGLVVPESDRQDPVHEWTANYSLSKKSQFRGVFHFRRGVCIVPVLLIMMSKYTMDVQSPGDPLSVYQTAGIESHVGPTPCDSTDIGLVASPKRLHKCQHQHGQRRPESNAASNGQNRKARPEHLRRRPAPEYVAGTHGWMSSPDSRPIGGDSS